MGIYTNFGQKLNYNMNSEKFHFEKGLNYSIFHVSRPTSYKNEPFLVPFPCILYCTNGQAKVSYNSEVFYIKKDDVFCIFSNTTLKGLEVQDNFEASVILFSNDVIIDSTIGFKAEYMSNIFRQPVKNLSDPNAKKIFAGLFYTLDAYNDLDNKYTRSSDFVYSIVRSLLIALAEISKDTDEKNIFAGYSGFSTTDNYFRDFLKLLSEHCKTQHNVAFYADKLCITPKYLNEICRKKTKHTAKEIITRSVIAQIKSALIISGTSVQRIAYDFNFCDQSSFGKYFKKAVGMAPMAFRNKHNENPDFEE